jgi:integrase
MDVERRGVVARALVSNRYRRDDFIVGRLDRGRVRLGDGTSARIDQMIPETRLRLVLADEAGRVEGPAMLWLGDDGVPMSPSSWHSVFRRANERCAEARLNVHITPHMLRHTFAVHMLSLLLAESMRPIRRMLRAGADAHTVALRRLLIDPVRILQLLLGHAQYTTTLDHYLPYVQQASEVSDAAVDRWQSVVGPRLQLAEDGAR